MDYDNSGRTSDKVCLGKKLPGGGYGKGIFSDQDHTTWFGQTVSYGCKVPITTAADDILHCSSEKIRLDISCESSARQRIHIKQQALFSSKDKSEKN